jgi:hypothetical protein
MARWMAVLVLGFVAGAAAIMLADPGTSEPRVLVSPAAATSTEGHAHTPTAVNGQEITGVKAQDIAAEEEPDKPLDAATRAALQDQLLRARAVALRYPTVADAEAAGYFLAGGFAPGSGAHYVGVGGFGGPNGIDIDKPGSLIYDGSAPDSKIVGLMYLGGGDEAPEGFAGPNDHWHRHSNVCIKFGGGKLEIPFPADADVTEEMCSGKGGSLMKITTWMVHAWVVPSWESPQGVFSHDNLNLRCGDGTYDTDKSGFCLT